MPLLPGYGETSVHFLVVLGYKWKRRNPHCVLPLICYGGKRKSSSTGEVRVVFQLEREEGGKKEMIFRVKI
jgi:hypothetical protein